MKYITYLALIGVVTVKADLPTSSLTCTLGIERLEDENESPPTLTNYGRDTSFPEEKSSLYWPGYNSYISDSEAAMRNGFDEAIWTTPYP